MVSWSNYIHEKQWDMITHPCPNVNGSLIKSDNEITHGWVITFHLIVYVINHPCLNLISNHINKRGPMNQMFSWTKNNTFVPNADTAIMKAPDKLNIACF